MIPRPPSWPRARVALFGLNNTRAGTASTSRPSLSDCAVVSRHRNRTGAQDQRQARESPGRAAVVPRIGLCRLAHHRPRQSWRKAPIRRAWRTSNLVRRGAVGCPHRVHSLSVRAAATAEGFPPALTRGRGQGLCALDVADRRGLGRFCASPPRTTLPLRLARWRTTRPSCGLVWSVVTRRAVPSACWILLSSSGSLRERCSGPR